MKTLILAALLIATTAHAVPMPRILEMPMPHSNSVTVSRSGLVCASYTRREGRAIVGKRINLTLCIDTFLGNAVGFGINARGRTVCVLSGQVVGRCLVLAGCGPSSTVCI
jgi:hypothetical protein